MTKPTGRTVGRPQSTVKKKGETNMSLEFEEGRYNHALITGVEVLPTSRFARRVAPIRGGGNLYRADVPSGGIVLALYRSGSGRTEGVRQIYPDNGAEFDTFDSAEQHYGLPEDTLWKVYSGQRVKIESPAVIVTRHKGLVEWLRGKGIQGDVITHVESVDQIAGKHVIGALPLHLASLAAKVTVVDMPNLSPELRGKDLTPEQMDAAGAQLRAYRVIDLS